MQKLILSTLGEIEQKHHIQIIYAVESGSRAWGFASADSDYDVRYIYIRPTEDYLRVNEIRDTIEGPLDDVLDFSGWDVRKALELLRRSNPSLLEWARSPIVYKTTPEWDMMAAAIPEYFSVSSNMHHYQAMYLRTWNTQLQGEQVRLKKYFYVLRPLLCSRYLAQYGVMPPIAFDELRAAMLPESLAPVVDELIRLKQTSDEKALISHIPVLDDFLQSEFARLDAVLHSMDKKPLLPYDRLNELFRKLIAQAWS